MKRFLKIIFVLFVMVQCITICQDRCFGANKWRDGTGEQVPLGTSAPSDLDTNIFNKIVDPLDRLLTNYRENMDLEYSSSTAVNVSDAKVLYEFGASSCDCMNTRTLRGRLFAPTHECMVT